LTCRRSSGTGRCRCCPRARFRSGPRCPGRRGRRCRRSP